MEIFELCSCCGKECTAMVFDKDGIKTEKSGTIINYHIPYVGPADYTAEPIIKVKFKEEVAFWKTENENEKDILLFKMSEVNIVPS